MIEDGQIESVSLERSTWSPHLTRKIRASPELRDLFHIKDHNQLTTLSLNILPVLYLNPSLPFNWSDLEWSCYETGAKTNDCSIGFLFLSYVVRRQQDYNLVPVFSGL